MIGQYVKYIDENSVEHDALLTAVHGQELGKCAVNLLYVSKDENQHDQYGRQILRASSVAAEVHPYSAHGRFYRVV